MLAISQSGIAYPFQFSTLGSVEVSAELARIRQSIVQILGTRPGERVRRPDFGCDLHALMFEPNTAIFQALARRRILAALAKWEPRITVLNVSFAYPEEHAVQITIAYRVGTEQDSVTYQTARG